MNPIDPAMLEVARTAYSERGGIPCHPEAMQAALTAAAIWHAGREEVLVAAKDGAYHERNQVVAALAKLFPSGTARTNIPGWEPEWHGCVYIDLPTGQVSWHYHDREAPLFADLPPYSGQYDGHDTPEKYRRLTALATTRGGASEPEPSREDIEKIIQDVKAGHIFMHTGVDRILDLFFGRKG